MLGGEGMDRRLSLAIVVTGLVVGMIGLLNVGLGLAQVISGALPSAEGRLLTPEISVGSIFFGLVMLTAGVLWAMSGVGYFLLKKWALTLALYVAPIIVAVNIVGVLKFWGFSVNIGWAALNTVTGVGSIWYLSRKELASFFIVSVAEHVFITIIFAILIYGEPVDVAESRDEEMVVTIERIEQQEPLLTDIIPRERAVNEKPPTLPEIDIQSVTATDPGTEFEDSVPQLPRTLAQVLDTGEEAILRSPGLTEKEQRHQDTVPTLDIDSTLDSSRKPSLDTGPSDIIKKNSEAAIAREPRQILDDTPFPDDRSGPSDGVARPSFVGTIAGDIVGRRLIFWPKQPEGYMGTEGGSTTIEFWVDPAGNVIKVEISKKSGNPRLDKIAAEYVEQIRFQELPKGSLKDQRGEIPMNFELVRRTE